MFSLISALILFTLISATTTWAAKPNPVLVISLDGFRADYLHEHKHLLSNLSIIANHVTTPFIQPIFPSLTFPNHYALATGCYAETHGIVHNSFLQPRTNDSSSTKFDHFKKSDDSHFWTSAEPLWISAVKQNISSAVFLWPGSVVNFNGHRPTYFQKRYIENVTLPQRVNKMLDLITKKNVRLAMVYYHQPDKTSHQFGPRSPEVKEMLRKLNKDIGEILIEIQKRQMENSLNLVIVSDHGLAKISPKRVIAIDELLAPRNHIEDLIDIRKMPLYSRYNIDSMTYGAVVHLWPRDDLVRPLYRRLKRARANLPRFEVYLKENLPDRWHYKNNERVAPVVMVAHPGWQIALYRHIFTTSFLEDMNGLHGYDNAFDEMRASFFAMGPAFKSNVTLDSFENVNVYSLLAHLAGIKPRPNNGSLLTFQRALKENVRYFFLSIFFFNMLSFECFLRFLRKWHYLKLLPLIMRTL